MVKDAAEDKAAEKTETKIELYETEKHKRQMVKDAAKVKAAEGVAAYAAARDIASAEADMLETAAEVKVEEELNAYVSKATQTAAEADMLETATELKEASRIASAEVAYDTATTKDYTKAMLTEAGNVILAKDKDQAKVDSYEKAKHQAEMVKDAAKDKTAEKTETNVELYETEKHKRQMVKDAKALERADEVKTYTAHQTKTEAKADLKAEGKYIAAAESYAAYAKAKDKSSEEDRLLRLAKKIAAADALTSYGIKTDKQAEKQAIERAAKIATEADNVKSYSVKTEKQAERLAIEKEAKLTSAADDVARYDERSAKLAKKSELGAEAKKIASADALANYSIKAEKQAEKLAIEKEAKRIAAAEGVARYDELGAKVTEEEKLLRIAKQIQVKENLFAYGEAIEKQAEKLAIEKEAKTLSAAADVTRYDKLGEKRTAEEQLLRKAKEIQAKDDLADYDAIVVNKAKTADIKKAAAAEKDAKALTAYDIAVAKQLRDQQYKIAASTYNYSTENIEDANKSLQSSAHTAEMLSAAKASRDSDAQKLYEKETEKKIANFTTPEQKKAIIKDYQNIKATEAYNRALAKEFPVVPQNSAELAEMSAAMLHDAKIEEEREAFFNLTKKDFKKFVKSERRDEKAILKDLKRTRHLYKTSTKSVGKQHLRASVDFSAELLEKYVENYKAALAARNKHYIKYYEKKANHALAEYVADLDLWAQTANEAVPYVSRTLIQDIKEGKEVGPIPYIDKEFKLDKKESRKLLQKDLKKFLREQEKLEIRAMEIEEAGKEAHLQDGDETVIAKYHMKTDLDTVKSRIEYRKQKYVQDFKRFNYTYGEETLSSELKHIAQAKKLKKMKKHTKKYIRFTKKNNERYYKLANIPSTSLHLKSEVKRDRAEILLKRIKNLLMERDEVNMRLLTLYADENANPEKKNTTQRKRIDRIKLRVSRRTFRKQRFLYREAKSYRVPQAQKDRIYEVMNRKTSLKAYLAECKYRKRHEHGNAKARRTIRKQIRETKRKLRYCECDLDVFMTKASKRSRRTPDKRIQFLWWLVLVALVCAGTMGYVFAMSHKTEILDAIGKGMAKIGELISHFTNK